MVHPTRSRAWPRCAHPREVTRAAADTLRLADHIFIEELRRAGCTTRPAGFRGIPAGKSVGVTGDAGAQPVIALRAVETVDFMTALGAPAVRAARRLFGAAS